MANTLLHATLGQTDPAEPASQFKKMTFCGMH